MLLSRLYIDLNCIVVAAILDSSQAGACAWFGMQSQQLADLPTALSLERVRWASCFFLNAAGLFAIHDSPSDTPETDIDDKEERLVSPVLMAWRKLSATVTKICDLPMEHSKHIFRTITSESFPPAIWGRQWVF